MILDQPLSRFLASTYKIENAGQKTTALAKAVCPGIRASGGGLYCFGVGFTSAATGEIRSPQPQIGQTTSPAA